MPTTDYATLLAELAQADQLRTRRVVDSVQDAALDIDGRRYVAFASNDYLGLANHPNVVAAAHRALDRYGVGAAASHLITGHMTPHHQLELALADFMRLPKALFFPSGYAANIGILTALAGRGDTIFSDQLNHACLIDGARLSRATCQRYAHGDIEALRQLLEASGPGRKVIATDAVFSMDGDIAPLPQLLQLAEEFNALLVVDDAHGFGVLGEDGRGTLSHFHLLSHPAAERIIYMATLGKAAGVYGAFVAGSEAVIEWLLQSARTYIFTTATPPMIAAALQASLAVLAHDHERRAHLHSMIALFTQSLKLKNAHLLPSQTAIQPIVIGDNSRTLQWAEALRERGFWVPAIRPPTVPIASSRLRVSLSAAHDAADVMDLIVALTDLDAGLDFPMGSNRV
ncbi:MAG: 8-amino-7-oxononanoate synthase [Betaproteobacteria bacterium]|nr:8-amino-7-oxononanoate synthase [Betaproteobacteria bacterium]